MAINMDDDVAGDMTVDADVDYHVDANFTIAVYFFMGQYQNRPLVWAKFFPTH